MLDIQRLEQNTEKAEELLKFRTEINQIDKALVINGERRKAQARADELRNKRNDLSKEIGIKKAIGARKQDIIFDFLADAFWISLKGSVIGISLTYLTAIVVDLVTPIVPVVPVAIPVIILLLSILIGVIFGVSPAISAANLDPVEALRAD